VTLLTGRHIAHRWLAGLAGVAAAVALTAAPAFADTNAATAGPALTPDRPLSGHLEASPDRQGRFAYYTFDYPGDRSVYTVNLKVTPDRTMDLVGFRVYGPEPDRVYAQGGWQPGLDKHSDDDVPTTRWNVSANLINLTPGTYVVQVFDWEPKIPIDYQIDLQHGDRPSEVSGHE